MPLVRRRCNHLVYPGGDPLELSTYSGRAYSVHPSLWSPSCDEHAGGGR